jgi:hypothetical protein
MVRQKYTANGRDEADAARRDLIEQMHHELADKLTTFDDRENWQRWLTFAGSFHQYSFLNTCLILMAKPDATLVAGYRAWQAKGHQVRRGEKAIKVFAPVTRKIPIEDADGRPALDDHGRPLHRYQLVGTKVASVFDASQVDPPPQLERPQPQLLVGQAPPGLWDALTELLAGEGFTVTRGDCGAANGLTDFTNKQVRVRLDVDDAHAVRTLSHEAGHVLTMEPDDIAAYGSTLCRGISEVIAESVAYLVTQAHGLDASQYTFNYVAGWATEAAGRRRDTWSIDQVVKATGDRVIAAAHRILAHTQPSIDATSELLAGQEAIILDINRTAPVWETVASREHDRAGDPRTAARSPNLCPRPVSAR